MVVQRHTFICFFITMAITLFLYTLQSTGLSLDQLKSQLIHFPVKTGFEGQSVVLEAKFDDVSTQVVYVRIFYRAKGSEDYQYLEPLYPSNP